MSADSGSFVRRPSHPSSPPSLRARHSYEASQRSANAEVRMKSLTERDKEEKAQTVIAARARQHAAKRRVQEKRRKSKAQTAIAARARQRAARKRTEEMRVARGLEPES